MVEDHQTEGQLAKTELSSESSVDETHYKDLEDSKDLVNQVSQGGERNGKS